MSYGRVGQRLVTNQGIRSRPVEVLESRFKAILLLAGANLILLPRNHKGLSARVIRGVNGHSRWTGIKAMGDDKGSEAGGEKILDPHGPPLSAGIGSIDDSTPAYNPIFTFLRGQR